MPDPYGLFIGAGRPSRRGVSRNLPTALRVVLKSISRPSRRGVSRNRDGYGFCVGRFRRPSRRGVSRNTSRRAFALNATVAPPAGA